MALELELFAVRADRRHDRLRRLLAACSVEAARMQRTITPEYMCQGCDCRRILIVIRSSPAWASRSSSLLNAPHGIRAGGFEKYLEDAGAVAPDQRIGAPCGLVH